MDADGSIVGSQTCISNMDIVAAAGQLPASENALKQHNWSRCGSVTERILTDGRVVGAVGIIKEHTPPTAALSEKVGARLRGLMS